MAFNLRNFIFTVSKIVGQLCNLLDAGLVGIEKAKSLATEVFIPLFNRVYPCSQTYLDFSNPHMAQPLQLDTSILHLTKPR